MRSRVYGPLISVSAFSGHVPLLRQVFGMQERGVTTLAPTQTERLFGTGGRAEVQVLQTPGVQAGAVLCRFDSTLPQASETVRTEETRTFRDAFRVIDFYAPDFDEALAHARSHGFALLDKEATYETQEGGFREAHHQGSDQVVTAFLHGSADFFTDFAEVRDRVASEPVSISLPLSDAAPTVDWYRAVFGWEVVYTYDFVDPSFSALMGTQEEYRVRSVTVGPSRQQTYVNIVDYGQPSGVGGSLHGRSVAPRRGLLGLAVLTDDLDEVLARAAAADCDHTPVVECEVAGEQTRVAALTAPVGSPHLVIETRTVLPAAEG